MIEPTLLDERDSRLVGRVGFTDSGALAFDGQSGYTLPVYQSNLSPWTNETSAMFRGVTNVILILGILLCPLYCGEGYDAVAAASPSQCSDDCCGCGCDGSTGEEPNGPTPCHDGCGRDCVCKGLLEGQVKLLLAHVNFWLPPCGDNYAAVPASLTLLSEGVRLDSATHPNLRSGAAIRLAFASLLI